MKVPFFFLAPSLRGEGDGTLHQGRGWYKVAKIQRTSGVNSALVGGQGA